MIDIKDQGEGIPPQAEPGYGLKNMHDRARLLGAILTIKSSPDKGTLVRLDLPMEEKNGSNSPTDC